MTSESTSHPVPTSPSRPQFGLGALLGCFVAIGMALAYLKGFESVLVFQNGLIVLILAVLLGMVVGSVVKQRRDAVFWSVIVSAAGYISVVGETHFGIAFHFAWSAVGGVAGVAAAAIPARQLVARMIASCLSGSTAMLIYFTFSSQRIGLEFDLLAAAIVSALVGLLVEIIMWVERRSQIPRYVTASWLLCAVIIGNSMVPFVVT
ncbi:MAG: hypothetical protein QGG71_00685 [Pirellulaceae bacterium]|nr:hypothetical protein [Pirellulaceae bacterium]